MKLEEKAALTPSAIPHTRGWGIAMAVLTAVISGFAIFFNSYGVAAWRDAGASTATYTTAKNIVAAALLGGLLFAMTRRRSTDGFTRPTRARQWAGLAAVGLIGGSVPFLLFFEGLARATSTQAAFFHKSLLIWVVILAVPLLGERLSWPHLGAIGLLVWGQLALAGGITDLGLGTGELMILAATLLWSVEVIIAKRLLGSLSPLTVGTARMGLGIAVLVAYGVFSGAFSGLAQLGWDQWGWALFTGLILTGYVATWYSGLARAQAVDVTAVLVFGAVITALLRSGVQGVDPASQGLGLVLITMGTAVLVALATLRRTEMVPR
ncbi:MAG: DMT family transporter [Acidimicrobiia bacterium]|nr:DMT family transporter [Acidimicrobiia bacterium]